VYQQKKKKKMAKGKHINTTWYRSGVRLTAVHVDDREGTRAKFE
jgi:hypothetical protein